MKTSAQELFQKIQCAVAEVLNISPEQVTLQCRFLEDLGASSLDILTLFMVLEEDLGREIPVEKARELSTVKDVVQYLSGTAISL